MLVDDWFQFALVFTLATIGVLVASVGIGFVIRQIWTLRNPTTRHRMVEKTRRAFMACRQRLHRVDLEFRLGVCILGLIILPLPFEIFVGTGVPHQGILGILTAGAIFGMLCTPFSVWRWRLWRGLGVIRMSLLTIAAGTYGTTWLIAFLIVMASD